MLEGVLLVEFHKMRSKALLSDCRRDNEGVQHHHLLRRSKGLPAGVFVHIYLLLIDNGSSDDLSVQFHHEQIIALDGRKRCLQGGVDAP